MPGDHTEHRRAVPRRAAERADVVEGEAEGEAPALGHEPVGGLVAGDAAVGGGQADAATGVGAERPEHQARRHAAARTR